MTEVTRGRRLKAGTRVEAAAGYHMPFTIGRVSKVLRDDRGHYWVQTERGDVVPERKLRRVRW